MHGFLCALLKVVATIHETFIKNAVPDSKHMCYFMGHHRNWSVFDQVIVYLIFFGLEEFLIISSEREYSCSISNTGQSENKVPLFSWVEIGHADTDHAETIRRQFLFEMNQNIFSIELLFLCIGINASADIFQRLELFSYLYFHRMEETITILLQLFQKLFVYRFQWFDINDIAHIIDLVVHLTFVCIECLTFLLSLVQPLVFDWLIHGFKHVFDALYAFP